MELPEERIPELADLLEGLDVEGDIDMSIVEQLPPLLRYQVLLHIKERNYVRAKNMAREAMHSENKSVGY